MGNFRHCPSIAEHGFRDSHRMAVGVYLSPPGRLWVEGGMGDLDFGSLPGDAVVFAFDVPDEVAEGYAVYEEPPGEGDTLTGEEIDAWLASPEPAVLPGALRYEYCIPAAVANGYCVGLVHWTGEHPTGGEPNTFAAKAR